MRVCDFDDNESEKKERNEKKTANGHQNLPPSTLFLSEFMRPMWIAPVHIATPNWQVIFETLILAIDAHLSSL